MKVLDCVVAFCTGIFAAAFFHFGFRINEAPICAEVIMHFAAAVIALAGKPDNRDRGRGFKEAVPIRQRKPVCFQLVNLVLQLFNHISGVFVRLLHIGSLVNTFGLPKIAVNLELCFLCGPSVPLKQFG